MYKKNKKRTQSVKVWVVSLPKDCLGQERKREVRGTLGQNWGWSPPLFLATLQPGLHKDVIYPPATSHCTNISSWVVRSGPWVEGERIRQRGQDDLSPMTFYLITYLRVVWFSMGFRKTSVVPFPSGGLAFLLGLAESFAFVPALLPLTGGRRQHPHIWRCVYRPQNTYVSDSPHCSPVTTYYCPHVLNVETEVQRGEETGPTSFHLRKDD